MATPEWSGDAAPSWLRWSRARTLLLPSWTIPPAVWQQWGGSGRRQCQHACRSSNHTCAVLPSPQEAGTGEQAPFKSIASLSDSPHLHTYIGLPYLWLLPIGKNGFRFNLVFIAVVLQVTYMLHCLFRWCVISESLSSSSLPRSSWDYRWVSAWGTQTHVIVIWDFGCHANRQQSPVCKKWPQAPHFSRYCQTPSPTHKSKIVLQFNWIYQMTEKYCELSGWPGLSSALENTTILWTSTEWSRGSEILPLSE